LTKLLSCGNTQYRIRDGKMIMNGGELDGGKSHSKKYIKISTRCLSQDSNYVGEQLLPICCYYSCIYVFQLKSEAKLYKYRLTS
jgi:hypothetical protein